MSAGCICVWSCGYAALVPYEYISKGEMFKWDIVVVRATSGLEVKKRNARKGAKINVQSELDRKRIGTESVMSITKKKRKHRLKSYDDDDDEANM